MYIVSEFQEFRKNIRNKIYEILKNKKITTNIEISIYNFTIIKCKEKNIVRKWSNEEFTRIYIDRFRSIYFNLKNKNSNLRKMINTISPKKLQTITHQEMNPKKWKERIDAKIKRDKNMTTVDMSAATDQFRCYKCKVNKCTYYQLQTRSADEPMTTFINCLNCGNKWKC